MKNRRKLIKGIAAAAWTTPVIQTVILPAHAQTSATTTAAPGTTTTVAPTTTTVAPMGCSARTCSSSSTAGNGSVGGLVFDGSGCFLQHDLGPAFALLSDPNLIFFTDNNSTGSVISTVGNANWSVSGLTAPDQVLGAFGSGSESRTFTATNNQTDERFEICLRISRDGDASPGSDHITYTVDIGPL